MFRRILVIAGVFAILAVVPAVAAASVTVMGSSTSNTQVRYAGDQWSDAMPNFEGASWRTPISNKHGAWGTVPGASWLSVFNGDHGKNPHWTEYRTSFSKLAGDHEYVVKFLADNAVVRMTVNGQAFGCTLAVPCDGFWHNPPLEQAIPTNYLNATANELRLVVLNYEYGDYSSGGLAFSVVAADPPDSDGDGVPDSEDAFPLDKHEQTDTDGDGIGNNADPDDDNDGVPDSGDACGTQSGGAQNGCPLPTMADQCKKDGYRNYGTTFINQGDCVSYIATGGKNGPAGS